MVSLTSMEYLLGATRSPHAPVHVVGWFLLYRRVLGVDHGHQRAVIHYGGPDSGRHSSGILF